MFVLKMQLAFRCICAYNKTNSPEQGRGSIMARKKIVPFVFIFLGAAFLLAAIFSWFDNLTASQPVGLGKWIFDILVALIGAGSGIKGWLDWNKKEPTSQITSNTAFENGQVASGKQGRNIQTEKYDEQTIQNYYEAPKIESAVLNSLHQLPPTPADFTGREAELKQVLENLTKNKGTAISGLTGMGGIGKTALGLVAAHEIADKYPDGQLFLDLKGVTDPLSPADIMRSVILAFEPTSDLREYDEDRLGARYRSALAEKKVLLFLDNALDAVQVRRLVPPDLCALIVTSRRSFALPGMDKPIRLDVLPERKAVQLLKRLCKRIKGSTNEIAKLCGYIPLALQISGTFLAVNLDWTPEEYMERLKAERLKLLKGDDDDAKFDLEAAIGLSYQQLTHDERKYWRMLSIFPTSFRREAVLAMCEFDENIGHDLLSKLNRMSLLDYDEKSERYSLHDLLADYALSQMEDGEEEEARLKHASHYMNVMSIADDLYLNGSDNILLGLRLFDLEREHIRVGQKWAADNHVKSKDIARLCSNYTSSVYCIDLRLHPRELISWHEAALLADRYLGDRRGEGADLGNLGFAYAALGDACKAIEFYEQQLVIVREIGDRGGEGAALFNMGLALHGLEEKDRAIELVKGALKIYVAIESPVAERARNALKEWGVEG